jgi:hypothetical protein
MVVLRILFYSNCVMVHWWVNKSGKLNTMHGISKSEVRAIKEIGLEK